MDVYVKLQKNQGHVVLAICDCELLGKTLHEGKITFKIKEEFYNGGKANVEEAVALIENSTIVNLVGQSCVESAIKRGYVHPEAVIKIQGVPHAQIMKL
jgi:hypothetical protein